jgi:murein tripeptide amidase MpaA
MLYKSLIPVLLLSLGLISCKSSEEFSGFSYDPPDVTNTTDKSIEFQPKRAVGVFNPKVWISNEFEGARANDVYLVNDSTIEVFIKPENHPINNSPWFAFQAWSDSSRLMNIRLNYFEARHRYVPKLLVSGAESAVSPAQFELPVHYDTVNGTAEFEILLSKEPLIISAQPLYTSSTLIPELHERDILGYDFIRMKEAGHSKLGRPILELTIDEVQSEEAPVLAILGRQHPPEVTGYLASLYFLEELTSDHELAKKFREVFVVKAIPMINPDGVDGGHWRHNAGGVDLNRDWKNFNQPETQIARDVFTEVHQQAGRKLYYGIDFHSTNENIFYPIDEEVKTTPDNLTQQWIQQIKADNPSVIFAVEEFDTSSPIAKNWFYHRFGIDAVTYEVDDGLEPDKLEEVSRSAAQSLMKILLERIEDVEN